MRLIVGRCYDPAYIAYLVEKEREEDERRAAQADRDTIALFQLAEAARLRPDLNGGVGLTIGLTSALWEVYSTGMRNADGSPAPPSRPVRPYLRRDVDTLCRMQMAEAVDADAGTFRLTYGGQRLIEQERQKVW